ncbi:MAG TPA: PadR family transcriptional regulator [Caldilineaceae bacterium]|nr:PadR family transcriptional regulator [Caldilineaceae bacterium]
MRTIASTSLTIEHALLGFVYEHPVHGYEIYQRLSASNGLWQVWRLKQSQLYALLAKLEEAEYLAASLQPQDARPPRKIYALTEAGRRAFLHWVTTPVTHGRQIRIEFRAKLYFAQRQGPAVLGQLLEQQTVTCQQWLAVYQKQSSPEVEKNFFLYTAHQFRLSQIESFLNWLATCQQALATQGEDDQGIHQTASSPPDSAHPNPPSSSTMDH